MNKILNVNWTAYAYARNVLCCRAYARGRFIVIEGGKSLISRLPANSSQANPTPPTAA